MVRFVSRGGFCVLLSPLDMLNRIFLISSQGLGCCLQQESRHPWGYPGPLRCLSLSQAGEPASQQGLSTSAFEPRNFFLAVGDAEPELILAAPGLPASTGSFCRVPPNRQGC